MLKKEHTCCFTGHRKIHANDESIIRASTLTHIQTLISKGVDTFIVGGALGYDTLVAKLLFEIRAETHSHVQVILAYPFNGFTDDWTTEEIYDFKSRLPLFDDTICIRNTPSREAYLARNRYMVDNSTYCIAYCRRKSGGSAYTVRYAHRNQCIMLHV